MTWAVLGSGDGHQQELSTQFASAEGTLPPALKYSFFVTGKSDDYSAFPSVYSAAALEFENAFHVSEARRSNSMTMTDDDDDDDDGR